MSVRWSKKTQNKIYCGNCGEAGHIYRNCRQPITSFGIILVKHNQLTDYVSSNNTNIDIFNDIEFLMIERKDSISYVEFIRGKYDIDKSGYISRLFEDMTPNERERIRKHGFKTLWDMLWMNHDLNIFKNEYDSAFLKFSTLQNGKKNSEGMYISILSLLDNTVSHYKTPEWEFPKGRRYIRESDQMCAIREFEEETGIPSTDYTIINSIPPFQELFTGSNNIKYRIIYYIGLYNSQKTPSVDPENITQTSEIGNLDWFKFHNAIKIIKSHFCEKKKVLTSVFNLLMLITDSMNIKHISSDDEEHMCTLTSIVSRYLRPPRQFYSKGMKTRGRQYHNSESD